MDTESRITELLSIILPGALVVFYILFTYRLSKTVTYLREKVSHLTVLMDIMASGMCSPIHREMYQKLSKMTIGEAEKALEDKNLFLKSLMNESFVNSRNFLEKIKEGTTDGKKKKEFQTAIDELDGMFNLLSTLDKETPREHVNQIMANVEMSLNKLRDKGIDIRFQGLDPFEQI